MLSSHNWLRLISPDFNLRNLFTLNWEALGSGLTSFGGLQPATESLCASVTDVLGFVLGWRVCQIRLDLASDSRVMVRVVEAHARYPLGITYSSDCSGCTTPYLWWSSTSVGSQARCSFTNSPTQQGIPTHRYGGPAALKVEIRQACFQWISQLGARPSTRSHPHPLATAPVLYRCSAYGTRNIAMSTLKSEDATQY